MSSQTHLTRARGVAEVRRHRLLHVLQCLLRVEHVPGRRVSGDVGKCRIVGKRFQPWRIQSIHDILNKDKAFY